MDAERHRRVKEILAEAIDLPPEERAGFVADACGDDEGLRTEVEELLALDGGTQEEFLERPLADERLEDEAATVVGGSGEHPGVRPAGMPSPAWRIAPGDRIGPYTIAERLGRGGMGEVFLAEQSEPVARRVALKVVAQTLADARSLARFDAERQAMARLSHPNIAQMYETGTTRAGFPYFAMELVSGPSLTTYCDRERLGIEERLHLFLAICSGVRHAHRKGIIHRDIKPSNLLVSEQAGRPVPKIIDFGIAKALDQPLSGATLTGLGIIGTPGYIAPEALRAGGSGVDLDTRADVYALGVVLYQLLTGSKPFEADTESLPEQLMKIAHEEAPAPSTRIGTLPSSDREELAQRRGTTAKALRQTLRGDLDCIVARATEPDREKRYESAADLADDIERYLDNEPVTARPPSVAYQTAKFVRRHRVGVASAAVVVVALLLGIVGTTLAMLRAREAESEALAQAQRGDREAAAAQEVADFLVGLFEVSEPGEARGNTVTARELLDQGAARIEDELGDQPLLAARMLATVGDVYRKLGLFEGAEHVLDSALELRRRELGEDDPSIAESLFALAELYRDSGRAALAATTFERSVELWERVAESGEPYDENHFAASLRGLANMYRERGDLDAAVPLLERVLDIERRILGPDHPDLATTANVLGGIALIGGRFEEAERQYRRGLEIRRRAFGDDHYLVANSLNNLSPALSQLGRREEAEQVARQALEIYRVSLGEDGSDYARQLSNLGWLLRRNDKLDEAASASRRALELNETLFGPDHPRVAGCLDNLGIVAWRRGRPEEAVAFLERSLAIRESVQGSRHPDVPLTLYSLASAYRDLERYDEAEPLYRRALALQLELSNPDHPAVAEIRKEYAELLRRTGREAEADAVERGEAPGGSD